MDIDMYYSKQIPFVVKLCDINSLIQEKFCSPAFQKPEIIGVINNTRCVSVFIVDFYFQPVDYFPLLKMIYVAPRPPSQSLAVE